MFEIFKPRAQALINEHYLTCYQAHETSRCKLVLNVKHFQNIEFFSSTYNLSCLCQIFKTSLNCFLYILGLQSLGIIVPFGVVP
jgi:hypothetical protein